MTADLNADVKGLVEFQRKMGQVVGDLRGQELQSGFEEAAMLVSNEAKRLAPIDTGGLRASITPDVRTIAGDIIAIVGTNKTYAPYQETGTDPFWPPLKALEVWARRHGTTAYVVARAIARRGIKGHHYLENGFKNNRTRIEKLIEGKVSKIVRK